MKLRPTSLRGAMAMLSGLALGSLMLSGTGAHAQDAGSRLQKGPIVDGTGRGVSKRGAPPPGLPGAATGQDRVSPSERPSTDMQPTDALFDSINRGDIVSARDALSRGADFNAHNVLGMTPLDQSIDLGRNDITFLLLSLRGSQPGPEQPPAATTASTKGARPAPKPVADQAAPRSTQRPAVQAPSRQDPSRQAQSSQAQSPRPGNPGVPNPQTGFLGFGG